MLVFLKFISLEIKTLFIEEYITESDQVIFEVRVTFGRRNSNRHFEIPLPLVVSESHGERGSAGV